MPKLTAPLLSLSLFLLLFVVSGCKEEFPVYAAFDQEGPLSLNCLQYSVLDLKEKQQLEDAFGLAEDRHCPYRVELIRYAVGNCNNPVVKSVGGDYNGYIRVEIKKGFKCYDKIQSDYKEDENAAFERVLKKIKMLY